MPEDEGFISNIMKKATVAEIRQCACFLGVANEVFYAGKLVENELVKKLILI